MKALSALASALGVNNTKEAARLFEPKQLKKIIDAMKDYADDTCRRQRIDCQEKFDEAYTNDRDFSEHSLTDIYIGRTIEEVETPEME